MAVQQPTPSSARPPPDVPFDPKLSEIMTQYLRTFSLWCRTGFSDSIRAHEAQPGLLLRAYDPAGAVLPAVYMVKVVVTAGTPALVLTPTDLAGDMRKRSIGSSP